jgi:hypothetical protein
MELLELPDFFLQQRPLGRTKRVPNGDHSARIVASATARCDAGQSQQQQKE